MPLRKLVSVEDMSREWWDETYSRCCDIINHPGDYIDSCRGKVLTTAFYEPSTRTSFSFQAAMQRLGGGVIGFSDPAGSSVSKGETLADTIRIAASYSDSIVIRSPHEGAAAAAALYSPVPIINAGDGGHFHPTQTLADLTTIAQKRGSIGNIRVGLCGDLKYGRTVHSLVAALMMFPNVSFYLISPQELAMPGYVLENMKSGGQRFEVMEKLEDCIAELDILYMTRLQRERFIDPAQYERLHGVYVLTKKLLERADKEMLIMHPLPRTGEIEYTLDCDPRAVYFEQARYGMFIRMSLLLDFCRQARINPPAVSYEYKTKNCRNPKCVTNAEPYLPTLYAKNSADRCGYCDKEF